MTNVSLVHFEGDDLSLADAAKAIGSIWVLTMERSLGVLEDDILLLKRWFDPVAQGQRLRRDLSGLPTVPASLKIPGSPWTMEVGTRKVLVTPEGRCLVDMARTKGRVGQDEALAQYDRLLARTYRDWSRHRLASVTALLAGTTKPLQIPAAGVVIALLVDGCIGPESALVRFADDRSRDVIDRAFFKAVSAFADVLAPSRRGKRDARLISGWMLYEARRRLGDLLVVEDFHGTSDGRVFITTDGVGSVVDMVARDLARGHRARATPELFEEAFDALVAALRAEMPNLAGFGLANERPPATRTLRSRFLAALESHAHAAS